MKVSCAFTASVEVVPHNVRAPEVLPKMFPPLAHAASAADLPNMLVVKEHPEPGIELKYTYRMYY